MVYQWKTAGLFKVDPNAAGAEIEACRDENGLIHPSEVVQHASHIGSVLHPCFEWDNQKAATKWREHQARVIVANLVTVCVSGEPKSEPITVRAFINVPGKQGRGYKTITGVLSDETDKAYMLERALGELRSFRAKYKALSELAGVFAAIDQIDALDAEFSMTQDVVFNMNGQTFGFSGRYVHDQSRVPA